MTDDRPPLRGYFIDIRVPQDFSQSFIASDNDSIATKHSFGSHESNGCIWSCLQSAVYLVTRWLLQYTGYGGDLFVYLVDEKVSDQDRPPPSVLWGIK